MMRLSGRAIESPGSWKAGRISGEVSTPNFANLNKSVVPLRLMKGVSLPVRL